MRSILPFLVCAMSAGSFSAAAPAPAYFGWRNLADEMGRKVDVRFEGMIDDEFYILRRRNDEKVYVTPPDFLLPVDKQFFDNAAIQLSAELTRLRVAASQDFFTGTPLHERGGAEMAEKLGLPPESVSAYTKSWRKYNSGNKDFLLFGAAPYSVALYADGDGKVTSLSVVYCNKGDYKSTRGTGEDHFKGGVEAGGKSLQDAMREDADAISAKLADALGPGKMQRFGEGKTRRTVKRWDWNGYSMILSHEDDEYVSLLVTPTEFADSGGKTAKVNDTQLRKRLRSSVIREDNGDVWISDIPMVNQGPKGYCVPATFERGMRTMGIDTDMYLLAMIGESGIGGGTYVGKLVENVRRMVYNKGRRTKDERPNELRIRDLKRILDDGVPIMWTMMALEDYGKIARENTTLRKTTAPDAWVVKVRAQNKEFDGRERMNENHHMCMIIGYNAKTEELAVTDSWGPDHALKWVPLKVADWASSHELFMILP